MNFACLNWLDREGNGRVNNATRKIPREMFIEESKYLILVKPNVLRKDTVFSVTSTNSILYEYNKYAMPKGKLQARDRVRVELSDDMIVFYKAETNEFLCKYKKLDGVGGVVTLNEDYADKVSVNEIKRIFGNNEIVNRYIEKIKAENPRYIYRQSMNLRQVAKYYTTAQINDAISYCLSAGKCNSEELCSYIIYKFGLTSANRFLCKEVRNRYLKRANEIKEKQDGKYQ